jgi:hypothetical protein
MVDLIAFSSSLQDPVCLFWDHCVVFCFLLGPLVLQTFNSSNLSGVLHPLTVKKNQ